MNKHYPVNSQKARERRHGRLFHSIDFHFTKFPDPAEPAVDQRTPNCKPNGSPGKHLPDPGAGRYPPSRRHGSAGLLAIPTPCRKFFRIS